MSEDEAREGCTHGETVLAADEVQEGGIAEALLRNAPEREGSFFAVPKMLEDAEP